LKTWPAAKIQAAIRELGWTPLPHQLPPSPPWDLWVLLGGRGSGKTDGDAHYVNRHALGPPCIDGPAPHRIGIIAPTHEDAKKTCVVGESGLRSHNPDIRFTPGGKAADLIWPNGALGNLFGAFTPEDVERLRGPQHCLLWFEELAAWRYLEECYDQAQFGLRLGPHPHAVASTTPKPRPFLVGSPGQEGLLNAATTVVTRATTDDNPHLAQRVRAELYRKYGGTRIGRQELHAEILADIPGALWHRDQISYAQPPMRVSRGVPMPDYRRVVVAIDPAVTYGPDSDETGMVVAGVGSDGRGYVIDDFSGRFSPNGWATRAIAWHEEHQADAIIAEVNNGGDMVENTLRSVGFAGRFIRVTASKGKRTRAEPVAALYEQGRVSHVRPFPELEDQLCTFTPDTVVSPDRLDAMVWAFTELMLGSRVVTDVSIANV
jgi:predicted phage terminase large subunit-like protein